MSTSGDDLAMVEFGNHSPADRKLLRRFVAFPHAHYAGEPRYVPLLDYQYLGCRILGITGFFESRNRFFTHAAIRFFMAFQGGRPVGRCAAFVNRRYNEHWNDKVGFFGQFESIEDQSVADALFGSAEQWLREQGMETVRGPQNLPVNDATPGFLTEGFDSRPVIYYHYNKPYYAEMAERSRYTPTRRLFSWEVDPMRPMEDQLVRVSQKVIDRYGVTIESWQERPLAERKREMLEIYNEAWRDNYGFVPFASEEFSQIIDDMLLIMDRKLFLFLYVKGEPAAFFGGVPNVSEALTPIGGFRCPELLRTMLMVIRVKRAKGFRLGYLGVRPKFRRLGLDGVLLWKQKLYSRTRYQYCDMGWVLDDNVMTIRLIEMMGATPSKTYTVFEKQL